MVGQLLLCPLKGLVGGMEGLCLSSVDAVLFAVIS